MLLDVAKAVIKANFVEGGIFDTRNVVGDPTEPLFIGNLFDHRGHMERLQIDVLPGDYFEVFGLTDEEFAELHQFYEELKMQIRKEEVTNELRRNLDEIAAFGYECSEPEDYVQLMKNIAYLVREAHEMIEELSNKD